MADRGGQDDMRERVRDFLSRYRHPNAVNGQEWTEGDVARLARIAECAHRPDPRNPSRCERCGATERIG